MRRGTACLVAAVIAGCGGGGDGADPGPIRGEAKRVADVVTALGRASRRGDAAVICDRLLTAAARRRQGGEDCARVLGETLADVRRPRLRLLSIRLSRAGATVRIRSRAAGQGPIDETLRLVPVSGRWRIASLSG